MTKTNSLAFFAGLRSNRAITALFIVLLVSFVVLLANFTQMNRHLRYEAEYLGHIGELRVLSQRMATEATAATTGSEKAFVSLKQTQAEFARRWDAVRNGDPASNLPALPARFSSQADAFEASWKKLQANTNTILASQKAVQSLYQVASTLSETVPQLQIEYEEVVDMLLDSHADAAQAAAAQRQILLAERIMGSMGRVLGGGSDTVESANAFGRDASLFGRVQTGMLQGSQPLGLQRVEDAEARNRLTEIAEMFQFVAGSVDEILETSLQLVSVREAAAAILSESAPILTQGEALSEAIESDSTNSWLSDLVRYGAAFFALGSILMIAFLMVREARLRLNETSASNERNQTAILRLLDEIGDLADGDLTVQATVTEDFTGAIADSINFSIDQLRELVETINQTAVQVATAAQETQATAMHLAEASEHQAQEIAGASAAINEMALSIDEVSKNASESANVAQRSVSIANKGNEVVHNTISGMDSIREQIQDTSKRIKRLGESSQEIGDIVSLINDIADQTNILALNAAIQASMAGDAGRGFAVVADEVQRLAERSSAATKQIETLVKAIQTDTNEAVISMEQTTSEVVRGANLAQDAGVALEEIERVSQTLSSLIESISGAARQQALSASHVSNTMNVIQEITSQTSAGTTATAINIGNLAQMASEMRNSVSGFTLPEGRES